MFSVLVFLSHPQLLPPCLVYGWPVRVSDNWHTRRVSGTVGYGKGMLSTVEWTSVAERDFGSLNLFYSGLAIKSQALTWNHRLQYPPDRLKNDFYIIFHRLSYKKDPYHFHLFTSGKNEIHNLNGMVHIISKLSLPLKEEHVNWCLFTFKLSNLSDACVQLS